ncbi:MAG: hypothetical protein WCF96_06655 [Eubacteriales bacterium]
MDNRNKRILAGIIVMLLAALGMGYIIWAQDDSGKVAALSEIKNIETIISDRNETLNKANKLVQGYYYQEAIDELNKATPLVILSDADSKYLDEDSTNKILKEEELVTSEKFQSRIKEIQDLKSSLVKYNGKVQHIFFHSLIVYPALAFDNKGRSANGYNMWMVTVSEFKKMLPELRDRGYILYNLSDYVEADQANPGQIKLKDIMVPPGKTPLVISIDDVSYYDYMKPDGFANKLVPGNDGKIYTEVISPDGTKALTRDGDVMPILDDFVTAYPDFSYRGAKGTIALTGFAGGMGYNFIAEKDPAKKAALIAEAKKTADLLKKNGWLFACHSYTHNQYFRDGTMTLEKMKHDLDRWILYMEPVVGKTNIYISPFGTRYKNTDPSFRYIVSNGFNIFCPVGNERKIYFNGDNIVMARVDIDGFSMNVRKDEITDNYFNVDQVYDKSRPKLVY